MQLYSLFLLLFLSSNIYAQSTWNNLLHFDPSTNKSKITNSKFFLTKNGNENPQAELEASLQKMRSETESTPLEERFSCRFPARKIYLEKLYPDIHSPPCPWLDSAFEKNLPKRILIVFASQYLGNPSSSMGHTFIRLENDPTTFVLGNSFSFAAQSQMKSDPTLIYIWKGLFGGYLGEYSLSQFYPKAREYGNIENRDLWEYEIKLTDEQKVFLLKHIYELAQSASEPYYFLNRNCGSVILDLLNLIFPEYNLSEDSNRLFYTPLQGLKFLSSHHLLGPGELRPSLFKKTLKSFEQLSPDEQNQVKELTSSENDHLNLTSIQNAKVLDVSMSVLTLKKYLNESTKQQNQNIYLLGVRRSTLPLESNLNPPITDDKIKLENPLLGHNPHQLSLGYINSNKINSLQIGFRMAGHRLEDNSAGYLENSEINFLEGELRIQSQNSSRKIFLNQFTLINIKSFTPFNIVTQSLSWAGTLAYIPLIGSSCSNCHSLRSEISTGVAYKVKTSTFYSMGKLIFDTWKPESQINFRIGPSFVTGLLLPFSEKIFSRLEYSLDYLKLNTKYRDFLANYEWQGSWHLSENNSIIISTKYAHNYASAAYSETEYQLKFTQHF